MGGPSPLLSLKIVGEKGDVRTGAGFPSVEFRPYLFLFFHIRYESWKTRVEITHKGGSGSDSSESDSFRLV